MRKITRGKLKEFIRQSIDELKEGGPGSGKPKDGGDEDKWDKFGTGQMSPDEEEEFYTSGGMEEEVKRKPRKTTVKEVKKWFKTLEENRYKKTYASDARRVSWMVNNNLSEDYEAMPKSMKKKWPKAAYKRERFLAKEFIKHLKGETKLRESIRRIIKGLIND